MKKKNNFKKVASKKVTVVDKSATYASLLGTAISITDNLSATAIAALIAHLYFGDGDLTIDAVLLSSSTYLVAMSHWMKMKMGKLVK